MALSPAEKQRRYRERKKEALKAAPDQTQSFLTTPFNEFIGNDPVGSDLWNEVRTSLEWAGINPDGIPSFDADDDPEHSEELGDGPVRGSIGRAERMVGSFLDAASHLADAINAYKRRELDRAIVEIEASDLSDPATRKHALKEIVRLNKLRDRLAKQVRWSFPEWKVKGD